MSSGLASAGSEHGGWQGGGLGGRREGPLTLAENDSASELRAQVRMVMRKMRSAAHPCGHGRLFTGLTKMDLGVRVNSVL